jgi:hypothetical protein
VSALAANGEIEQRRQILALAQQLFAIAAGAHEPAHQRAHVARGVLGAQEAVEAVRQRDRGARRQDADHRPAHEAPLGEQGWLGQVDERDARRVAVGDEALEPHARVERGSRGPKKRDAEFLRVGHCFAHDPPPAV